MINKLDAIEIKMKMADTFSVLLQHRSVDISAEDTEKLLNLLDEVLSNYVDNTHILNRQINPKTGVAEAVE